MTTLPELSPLRPYQERGMRDLRAAARRLRQQATGYGILAVAPTGAGKTRLALEIATGAIRKRGRVLWLAPRTELVDQPVARLAECGWTDVQIVQGGRVQGHPDASIAVASIQTLVARQYAPPADVLVLDEARHYVASEWGQIAGAYRDAVRIGLDATPARSDGLGLRDLFDELIPISDIAELTREGWLVPARILAPDAHQKGLADTPLDAYQRETPGKRCLVFCRSKRHAHETAAAFRAAGIPSEAVDANTPADQRRAALDRVRSGETLVLCNCNLFTEGLDLVELEAIIIARGVGHPAVWIQIGGRGLRPSPHTGKTHCTIIDLHGHFHRPGYGPLDDPRTWSLDGKALRKVESLEPCVQCRSCHAWHRGGGRPCVVCGAALPAPPPPKLSRAELKEQQRRARLASIAPTDRRWRLWCELVRTMRRRGYKPQWAFFSYRQRTGFAPPFKVDDVPLEQAAS